MLGCRRIRYTIHSFSLFNYQKASFYQFNSIRRHPYLPTMPERLMKSKTGCGPPCMRHLKSSTGNSSPFTGTSAESSLNGKRKKAGHGFAPGISRPQRLFSPKYLLNAYILYVLPGKPKTAANGCRNWMDAQSDHFGQMRIHRLHIRLCQGVGFKNLIDFTIDFYNDSPAAVLVRRDGTGKDIGG